jgi:hypothetical protein
MRKEHSRDVGEARLTRAEYWLLDAAVEAKLPIRLLGSGRMEECLNRPGHGVGCGQLIEALNGLFAARLLAAWRRGLPRAFVPTRDELAAEIKRPEHLNGVVYGLTQRGGTAWEAFAAPQWEMFLEASDRFDDVRGPGGQLICARKRVLQRVLEACSRARKVAGESVKWDIIRPWKATYWKRLPFGHRVRFCWREVDCATLDGPESVRQSELEHAYGLELESVRRAWCQWH